MRRAGASAQPDFDFAADPCPCWAVSWLSWPQEHSYPDMLHYVTAVAPSFTHTGTRGSHPHRGTYARCARKRKASLLYPSLFLLAYSSP